MMDLAQSVASFYSHETAFRAVAVLSFCCIAALISKAIVNIFYHPLSHVPGPWFCAASRFPYMYYATSGQLAVKLRDLHDRHGPVVRTAPDEVSFTEPDAWDAIHCQRAENGYAFPKNYDTFNETRNQFTHTVFLAREADHARMKKALQPSFTEDRVRDFEPRLQGHIDSLVDAIQQDVDIAPSELPKETDLNDWFNWFAFDVAVDYTLGHSFDCIRSTEYRWWLKRLSKTWRFIIIVNNLKAIAKLLKVVSHFVPTSMLQRKVDILRPITAQALHQTQHPPSQSTVMSTCTVEKGGVSSGLRPEEVTPNASLIVAAGTDTGSTVLPGILYLLSQNPEALKMVVSEIRGNNRKPEDITLESVNQMPYLKACIREVLRLYTTVPEGLPRSVPQPGSTICGYWIPAGSCVQVSGYAACMSSANFAEPTAFAPERWLPTSKDNELFRFDRKGAARPFSAGPHNCLGQILANGMLRLTTAKFLYHFDISYPSSANWLDQPSYMLWERKPLRMIVSKAQFPC